MSRATVYRHTEPLGGAGDFLKSAADFLKEHLSADERVVCALSGGVDSSVTARIFERAVGDRLHPIHFDTGFMRRVRGREEVELVAERFGDLENFELVDRSDLFHENVFGMEDSEDKRRAFRSTYERVLNEKIEEVGASAITQGTIRPDIMETEGEIKSQNNVDTNFDVDKMVEPLAGLYKPDVRLLARELGFSQEVYLRQPFPGPGLSVRAVGTIDDAKLENEKISNDLVERSVEAYFEGNYGRSNLWDEVSGSRIPFQYFAATFDNEMEGHDGVNDYLEGLGLEASAYSLRNRATGVAGDGGKRERVYAPPVLIEGDLRQEVVHALGRRIPGRFDVSRVLYGLTELGGGGDWLVSIRAVDSEDAIDAEPLLIPFPELEDIGDRIVGETDAAAVAYDVSPKPPATIEYE